MYHFSLLLFLLKDWGLDVLLFSEFLNLVSILYYNFIESIVLLHTFLVIEFAWYKEYMSWCISFSKFSDVLPDFTCTSAIDSMWSISLGANIRRSIAKSERRCFPCVGLNGNIPLLKALRVNSWPS